MKKYKAIDIIIQVLIMLAMILGAAFGFGAFLYAMVLLGFVQIISMLVHLPVKEEWKSKLRKIYYWALLLPVGGFIYALNQESKEKYDMPGLETMMYVLLVSLLLAVFYFIISIIEWRKMKKAI